MTKDCHLNSHWGEIFQSAVLHCSIDENQIRLWERWSILHNHQLWKNNWDSQRWMNSTSSFRRKRWLKNTIGSLMTRLVKLSEDGKEEAKLLSSLFRKKTFDLNGEILVSSSLSQARVRGFSLFPLIFLPHILHDQSLKLVHQVSCSHQICIPFLSLCQLLVLFTQRLLNMVATTSPLYDGFVYPHWPWQHLHNAALLCYFREQASVPQSK